MTYDKDLQRGRRICSGLTLANVATALINGWERNWAVVLASTIWALCCLFMLVFAKAQQQTRDEARVTQAGIHALLERQEP